MGNYNCRWTLSAEAGRLYTIVDGLDIPLHHFTRRLRDGEAQVYYPESTFAYYSGDCDRVRRLLKRYTLSFRRIVQQPERDNLRPLFVLSTNQQARHILLALIAHRHVNFLERLRISGARRIKIVTQSPKSFDSDDDEPILWGTSGKTRKTIGALNETAHGEESHRVALQITDATDVVRSRYQETRVYRFEDNFQSSKPEHDLRRRLELGHDNLYLALEHLAARGILKSVEYELIGESCPEPFDFDQLSEGEKQLIAVIGAIHLTNQRDNLILLDEPDTHLNPQWSWEYPEMLEEAFDVSQKAHSTVLMATHDPVVISGLVRDQVLLANGNGTDCSTFERPIRHPRGQGVANLLCSSEFFGLPSSLDKNTQILMDERLRLSLKETLTDEDKLRLKELNQKLQILQPGISETDPDYVAFLRRRYETNRGKI